MVPLAAPTVVVTGVLLHMGAKGAELAQTLGLPVAIYATVGVFIAKADGNGERRGGGWRRKAVVAAVMLVVGGMLPAAGWFWYERYSDPDVGMGGGISVDRAGSRAGHA